MTVSDTGFAALQFPPLGEQVLVGHPVVAIVAVLVLVEFYLSLFKGYSLLIILSSLVFSEIKTPLRIALTVLPAVLLVV